MDIKKIIEKLYNDNNLESSELLFLLDNIDEENNKLLSEYSHKTRLKTYGTRVFMRGLVEFSSYCKNDCVYCGIRKSNKKAERYRLDIDEIVSLCEEGYSLGYRTFVLQGGEDNYFTDDKFVLAIKNIKEKMPDCAITLSLGERSYESYKKLYDAGADRYLLRHETASKELYNSLHPDMNFDNRVKCLNNLKEIGFQVGAGFMVGLPNQTNQDFVNDIMFLKQLEPHMIGIGPFISHKDTPLANEKNGTVEKTLLLLSIVRLFLPKVLLPSTTALGTIDPDGREKGLIAGGNVVMPNLTPTEVKGKYLLYDGKICTGDEARACRKCIENRILKTGLTVDMSRGDHISHEE